MKKGARPAYCCLKKNLNVSRLCFLHIKNVPFSAQYLLTSALIQLTRKRVHYEKSKRNKREKNKKIGPRKSDVAGDMLDKGDKEAIAPTRHARPITISKEEESRIANQHNKIARFYPSCTCCVVWFIMKKVVGTKFEPVLCC